MVVFACAGCNGVAQKSDLPRAESRQPNYRIVTNDKFRDGKRITVVTLDPMVIEDPGDSGEPIDVASMFVYDKDSPVVPAANISFHSLASKCRFPQKAVVTFVIDGEQLRIEDEPQAVKKDQGTAISLSEREGARCKESLNLMIPQAQYFQIANARTVAVRFGDLKFRLNQNQLDALRDLARRITTLKS